MSFLAALALAASTSTATLPHCSWNRPGANPFTGDLIAAVDRYKDIPADTRAKLKARMAKREYDEIALITRGAILGKSTYSAEIRDMHFGSGQVCQTVSRKRWSDTHQERGLVYCQDGHCLIVPTVCRNLSRIVRNQLEPIAGAAEEEPMVLAALLDGEAPLEFEAPGAGGDQPLAGASFDSLAGAPEGSELGPHGRPSGFVPGSPNPSFNQLSDPSSPDLPSLPSLPAFWPQPDSPSRLPTQTSPTPETPPPGTPTPGPVPPELPQPPTLLPNPPVPPKPEPLPPLTPPQPETPDTPDSPDTPPGGGGGGGNPPGGGGGNPPGGGGGNPPGGGGGNPPGGGGGNPPGGGGGNPPGGGGGNPPGGGGGNPPGGGGGNPPGGGGGNPPGGGGGNPPPPPPPPPFNPEPDPLPPPPPFDPKDPPQPEGDPFPPPPGGPQGGGGGNVPEPGSLLLGLLGLLGLAAARRR